MTFSHADDLELLREAAIAAGRVALGFFRNDVEVFWKNDGASPVTAADHAANDVLKARLLAARPDYGWLSEESEDDVSRLGASRVFVIDPIDGTRAFMTGRETWAVSAAVVEAGRPVAGVLFAPALNELYLADAGGRVEKTARRCASAGAIRRAASRSAPPTTPWRVSMRMSEPAWTRWGAFPRSPIAWP
nr:3'(2'),5'-bisphosphate nucleotidase CysQ [Rhizobium sp. G21]